jgi:hypothetical protein
VQQQKEFSTQRGKLAGAVGVCSSEKGLANAATEVLWLAK